MFETIFECLRLECFTFSIPAWVVVIVVILFWLIYWDKSSFKLKTKSLATKIKEASGFADASTQDTISKREVPSRIENDEELKIQTIKIGQGSQLNAERRSILLISAPHSGKTTLVEEIMNYIFGVRFDDDSRLCLSQSINDEIYYDWMKVYHIEGYEGRRINFPFTIYDVPRISSRIRDENQLLKQIEYVMNSVCAKINLICLVTRGNDSHMSTERMQYFRSILSIFQDHLKSNFCTLFTYADAGEASIQEILQTNEIIPVKSFYFNWSSLFPSSHCYSQPFWRMNSFQLDSFFDFIKQSSAKGICRKKELPTPEKREELKKDIATLHPEITKDLSKMGEMKSQKEIFETRKEEIYSSGDISFTIKEIQQIIEDLAQGKHVTNCMHCLFTCHDDCSIADDDGKARCVAMKDGFCTVCTGNCKWDIHKNTPYIYKYIEEEVTKSYQQMKLICEEKGKQLTYEEYLEQLNKDIEAFLRRLSDKVERMTEYQNELQGIERCPISLSVGDTIDDLIEAEKRKQEKGFEKRIEMCEELKKFQKWFKIRQVQNQATLLYQR